MVSGEYFNENGEAVAYSAHKLASIKLITASHYSFVTVSDVKLWAAGTGTYELTPKYYIETVIHTSYGAPKGKRYTFKYKLEDDFWYHTRMEDGERKEYEVWRKIKKPLVNEVLAQENIAIEAEIQAPISTDNSLEKIKLPNEESKVTELKDSQLQDVERLNDQSNKAQESE
jgi:hypothetical protein